jgi:predicted CXXCH cytochrome family protein
VQHQPFLADNCTGCHEPHGSDYTPLLVEAQPALCYNCHPAIQNQFAQSSRHPIGVDLQCGSCHNPHAAQYQGLVSAQDNSFCYQCHADAQPLYADSKHSVLLCVKCHTPHGSAYQPILVAENPDLCLTCHPTLEGQNKHPVRQEFFDVHAKKGLTCSSSCHNPHGTNSEFMLRNFNSPQDGQCLQCHKFVGVYF